ncbi:MAG: hypothetical protein C4K49_03565 [Candidatus Thorarchaeota archaeon]|nr:MAG: hypothetical protein C4K49_03565 [Candidatus Thorarchaeota archaeon]
MTFSMHVPQSYDLLLSVHAWVYPDIQPVPESTWEDAFGRLFTIGDVCTPIVVSQSSAGRPLHVDFEDDSTSRDAVRRKVRQVLGLDIDTTGALACIAGDPVIHEIASQVRGIRPYTADTVFEALIKAIVQQQISYRAASVITKRIVSKFAVPSVCCKHLLYPFPDGRMILSGGSSKLADIGLGFKGRYVHEVCSMVASGTLELEDLIGRTADAAREALSGIKGIGDWTLNALAISSLGDFSVFPYNDVGMRNLLGRLYKRRERVSEAEVREMAGQWGTEGPLVLYLLMCADVLGTISSARRSKTHKR